MNPFSLLLGKAVQQHSSVELPVRPWKAFQWTNSQRLLWWPALAGQEPQSVPNHPPDMGFFTVPCPTAQTSTTASPHGHCWLAARRGRRLQLLLSLSPGSRCSPSSQPDLSYCGLILMPFHQSMMVPPTEK